MNFNQAEKEYIEALERGSSCCIIKEKGDEWSIATTRNCLEYQLKYHYQEIYVFTFLNH